MTGTSDNDINVTRGYDTGINRGRRQFVKTRTTKTMVLFPFKISEFLT